MLRFLAVLPLVLATDVDAKCAMMGLEPAVLTKSGATLPNDGGIVVGAADAQGSRLDKGDIAVQAGWKLRVGGRRIAPKIDTLAPGLAVYRLPAGATTAELEDDNQKVVATAALATAQRPLLAAPAARRIVYTGGQGRRPFAHLEVELDGAVPAGALAIVLADAKGTPRSWHVVVPGARTAVAYDLTRCRVLANGTVESRLGDKVVVMWVDDAGRLSPATRPLAVIGTPPAPNDD